MQNAIYIGFIAEDNNEKYTLLLYRNDMLFSFPGGMVKENEIQEDAIWRILHEELGLTEDDCLDIKNKQTMKLIRSDEIGNDIIKHFYRCNVSIIILRALQANACISDAMIKDYFGVIILPASEAKADYLEMMDMLSDTVNLQLSSLYSDEEKNIEDNN